jgi:hypothetical protein
MNKLSISCILAILVLFPSAAVFSADLNTFDMKKISDELKRDRQEAQRNQQMVEQTIKQDRDTARKIDEQIKQDSLEAKRIRDEERRARQQLARAASAKPNKFIEFIASWPMQFVFYFLIIAGAGFIFYRRVLAPRKKPAEEEAGLEEMGPDVLAAVNQWRLREKDFKKYYARFASLPDAQGLAVDSPEFKKRFIRDLVTTEIIFQAAIGKKMDSDPVFLASLNQYREYLAGLNKNEATFLKALNNYKLSFTMPAGQPAAYAAYYKDFLNLLIILNKQDETEVFELYERYLLINRIAADISSGSTDAVLAQRGLDVLINKFKLEHNVAIREESPVNPP